MGGSLVPSKFRQIQKHKTLVMEKLKSVKFKMLSKSEMKMLKGGVVEQQLDGRCLGCTTDYDCARINKGTCSKQCSDGKGSLWGCNQW